MFYAIKQGIAGTHSTHFSSYMLLNDNIQSLLYQLYNALTAIEYSVCQAIKAIVFSNNCCIHRFAAILLLNKHWQSLFHILYVHLWFHFRLYNVFYTDPTDQ